MSTIESNSNEVIANGVTTINVPPNAVFKRYTADRPPLGRLKTSEFVLDVAIAVTHPVKDVWPIFKDFNAWMSRYGYFWDDVPADNENRIVSLGNKGDNENKYGREGASAKYIVRKVIPGQLIYFEMMPLSLMGKDGILLGHTVVSMTEACGRTNIVFFMEHTFCSETASIEELRAEAKNGVEAVVAFWRDYFIADLNAALESRLGGPSGGA
jgi:hypothetical protein